MRSHSRWECPHVAMRCYKSVGRAMAPMLPALGGAIGTAVLPGVGTAIGTGAGTVAGAGMGAASAPDSPQAQSAKVAMPQGGAIGLGSQPAPGLNFGSNAQPMNPQDYAKRQLQLGA